MTSGTNNFDPKQWLEARYKADPQLKRRIEEDEERREREHLAELQAMEKEGRGGGHVTRTLVFVFVLRLLFYWLAMPPEDITSRPLGSLTLKEVGPLVAFICALIWCFWRQLSNDIIDWETW